MFYVCTKFYKSVPEYLVKHLCLHAVQNMASLYTVIRTVVFQIRSITKIDTKNYLKKWHAFKVSLK